MNPITDDTASKGQVMKQENQTQGQETQGQETQIKNNGDTLTTPQLIKIITFAITLLYVLLHLIDRIL